MKILFHSFLAFISMLPLGLMAQNPVGAWKMSIPDEAGKMTPLKLDLLADGIYTIDFGADGTMEIKGKYTIEGDKMTIQDTEGSDCTEQGVYILKIEGMHIKKVDFQYVINFLVDNASNHAKADLSCRNEVKTPTQPKPL